MSLFSRKCVLAAAALIGLAGSVQAAEILQFTSTGNNSDIAFNGSALVTGAGASQDLSLYTADFDPGVIVVPVGTGQDVTDTQNFYNATLTLTGFATNGIASQVGSTVTQPLGTGTFAVTGPGGALLLSGHASAATLSGTGGQAGTFSAFVTYDSGTLLNYVAAPGATGSFSWTLTLLSGAPLGVTSNHATAFSASASGDFEVNSVPTPSAVLGGSSLIGLAGLAQFRRRRSAAL